MPRVSRIAWYSRPTELRCSPKYEFAISSGTKSGSLRSSVIGKPNETGDASVSLSTMQDLDARRRAWAQARRSPATVPSGSVSMSLRTRASNPPG